MVVDTGVDTEMFVDQGIWTVSVNDPNCCLS